MTKYLTSVIPRLDRGIQRRTRHFFKCPKFNRECYNLKLEERTMQPTLIKEIEKTQMRKTPLPQFSQGDTVVVYVKVTEGARERLQAFEGTVIAIKNRG